MAPKKAAKPNGFVSFAQDLMKQHGRKYNSLKEAVEAAGPLWARMSADQRRPYNEQAKGMRGPPTRYTSEGLDVEALTREERMKAQAEEKARQDTRNIITMAYHKGEEALASESFFVIHCNIFCYYAASDRYYPAEISVLSFSLKDGVKQENIFYYLVQPGPLPVGYKFESRQHSDETHLLKVPLDSDAENNQEDVYFNLKAFLEKKKSPGTKRMPIVYADKKNIKMIRRILNCWCEDYDTETDLFRVYNLQEMFYFLRNTVAGGPVWTSLTFSDRELEKDVYSHNTSIACEYHANTSKPQYCSQSIVICYAYMICDNCCSDLNIELEPGQHVPVASAIPETGSMCGSTSTRSSKKSSHFGGRRRNEFDSEFETDSNADTFDTASIISNSSTITTTNLDDDQFPSLGRSHSQSQNSDLSGFSQANSSSAISYAGATGRSTIPSAFERSIGSMSISSGTPKGRGFRRRMNDSSSDTSSVSGAAAANFVSSDSSDFPPIGRGRGFVARHARNPGVPSNNN